MHPWPQTVLFLFPGEVWPKHCYLLMCRSFSLARRKRSTHPKKISTAFYEDLHTHTHISHLMMKSNSDPASMSTPSSVEIAPSTTGANMCSRATAERLFLLPIAVRKPCSRRGGWGRGERRNELEILPITQKLCLRRKLGRHQNSCLWFC